MTPDVAPFFNVNFWVTSPFGVLPDRTHKGIDIATSRAGGSVPLYSMGRWRVIQVGYEEGGFGNYIIMKDDISKEGFLYGHMAQPSTRRVGELLNFGDQVGLEGSTGQSTGLHTHVEWKTLGYSDTWRFNDPISLYMNPAEFMGIRNVESGPYLFPYTPPIPPTPTIKQKKFKWVLYSRNIKNRQKSILDFK